MHNTIRRLGVPVATLALAASLGPAALAVNEHQPEPYAGLHCELLADGPGHATHHLCNPVDPVPVDATTVVTSLQTYIDDLYRDYDGERLAAAAGQSTIAAQRAVIARKQQRIQHQAKVIRQLRARLHHR